MPASESGLVVSTPDGDVRGYGRGDTVSWKGIPFAAPPVGPLRFRAPRPPEPWEGIRDGRDFGAMAPQGREGPVPMDPNIPIDEDCLTLNVWAPTPDGVQRPVMVWIHGGAYVLGSSAQRIYNGRNLSHLGEVVVVTVNYRVGALGWLDLSSFGSAEDPFETNLGLRDQIAALTWVRDCIAAFGGDPSNVTVFGESSGGASVTTLMTSPHAEGLFHKAIAQSSPATSVYGSERARTVAERFLELVDLTPDTAHELRTMPVDKLVDAAEKLVYEIPEKVPGTLGFAPVVDGDVVPRYPVAAFQKGFSHDIPLIIGSNHDEASVFRLMKSPLMPVTSDTVSTMFDAIAADHPELSPERIAEIMSAYPDLPKSAGALALSRDAGFRMPSLWIAEAHCTRSPTFVYRFDHATPVLRAARIGAGHATELPYVFGNFGTFPRDPTFWLGGRKAAQQVSRRIQRRWVAFAWHGVPAALDGSKHWAPYDSDRKTLVIDANDMLVSDPDRDLRAVWGERVLGFS
ncbi:MAG: carboxylesterase/lipase family protein [Rhodococcus sp. (in: high G+C Gram-positive bacteria)]